VRELDDLIARHVAARGGAAALDRVRAVRMDVEVRVRGLDLLVTYEAGVDGRVAVEVFRDGERVYAEGIEAGADGDVALRHGAELHLFGLHRFAERGHRLALVAENEVEVTFANGALATLTLAPLLVARRDVRAYHPEADERKQRIESRYSDFVAVDGVLAAHASEDVDLDTGAVLATQRVLRRELTL
jgi:hypothetical protein